MPQEITRTQTEKYTVYTGPTAESFSPIMAGITYPDPAYEILVYRRPLCVFEYVLSGRGHIERNGSILTVNAGDAYILTAGTYHHYYSDKVDPWTKIWFNVSGSLVQHLLSDYGLDGVTLIPRFHNETPLTRILDAFTADPVHSADKLAVTAPSIYSGACGFSGKQSSHQSYCTGDPQLYRYALNRKSVLGSSGRYRFPVPAPGSSTCSRRYIMLLPTSITCPRSASWPSPC